MINSSDYFSAFSKHLSVVSSTYKTPQITEIFHFILTVVFTTYPGRTGVLGGGGIQSNWEMDGTVESKYKFRGEDYSNRGRFWEISSLLLYRVGLQYDELQAPFRCEATAVWP